MFSDEVFGFILFLFVFVCCAVQFTFKIGLLTVVDNAKTKPFVGPGSSYYRANGTVIFEPEDVLKAFSSIQSHSQFCEAIHFTYLDFRGVLGLAWLPLASDPRKGGGICENSHVSSFHTRRKEPLDSNCAFMLVQSSSDLKIPPRVVGLPEDCRSMKSQWRSKASVPSVLILFLLYGALS